MPEANRSRTPAKRPTRRSQAERTAETRARVMRAVVECIEELGFGRTTAAEITRRAGVTWGAVQHQFGDKEGILRAVLEESFARFAVRFADMPGPRAPLALRVSAFVERAWGHFGSADYQSTLEILLQVQRAGVAADLPDWQSGMSDAWSRLWGGAFADSALARRESVILQHYTVSVLSGIAVTRMLGDVHPKELAAELDLLKETLVRKLGGTS